MFRFPLSLRLVPLRPEAVAVALALLKSKVIVQRLQQVRQVRQVRQLA